MSRGRLDHNRGRPPRTPGGPGTSSPPRPYRLITSDDPCKTLGQGEVRYFARIIDAANAFAKAPEPYKQLIYDDGHTARFLTRDEQWMLESVCGFHGYELEEHDYRYGGLD